jgi:hypothetical protein
MDVRKQRICIPIRGLRKRRKGQSNKGRTKKEGKKGCIYAEGGKKGRKGTCKYREGYIRTKVKKGK